MQRVLSVSIVVILLAAYGVAEGVWTGRWSVAPDLAESQDRHSSLPLTVGTWRAEKMEMDDRTINRAELRAYVLRRYIHADNGEVVTVMAVCGKPGPIAVHSPEICYGGTGFVPKGTRVLHKVSADGMSTPAEFWSERYEKKGAVPEYIHIYYGWNPTTGWEAVDNPRMKFASVRALYKIYVVRHLTRPDEPAEENPVPAFLRLLIPQLDHCLTEKL